MSTNINANVVVEDSRQILTVWTANTDFRLGDITLPKFKASADQLQATLDKIAETELELKALINARDDQAVALNEWNTRAHSGIRGAFGPDSTEYEQAGGTRKSERKKPSRRTAAPQNKAA